MTWRDMAAVSLIHLDVFASDEIIFSLQIKKTIPASLEEIPDVHL
jgi:hypothetical protein